MQKVSLDNFYNVLQFPVFKHLNKKDINGFAKSHREISYKKGETIIKQGLSALHVVCIASGLAKMYIEDHHKEFILRLFKPYEMIGFQAILGELDYQYSLAAIEPTTAILLNVEQFRSIVSSNRKFNNDFIKYLSFGGLQLIKRTTSIAHKQMHGKMAEVLLYLYTYIYNKQNPFPLYLSRQDLADMAAISVESTIRILKNFKESKLIEIKQNTITILEFNQLTQISEHG